MCSRLVTLSLDLCYWVASLYRNMRAIKHFYHLMNMCNFLNENLNGWKHQWEYFVIFISLFWDNNNSLFRNTSKMQNISEKGLPYLVTLNPSHTPENTLLKWTTGHPIPSVAASKASLEFDDIQGKRGIWFCGAYQGEQSCGAKNMQNFL